jgi:hypothetical protein
MDTAREAFGPQGSTQNPEPSADGHMDARDEGLGAAAEFGLVAKWSREFGYVSIHDPTTGEWYDIQMKDAPEWARWEANKRLELYRAGRRNAYRLTALQIQKIWDQEHMEVPEESPSLTKRGYVWEDHMEDAE